MMIGMTTSDVVFYSTRVLMIVAAAAAGVMILKPPLPRVRFAYWWAVIVACAVLPLVPRLAPPPVADSIVSAARSVLLGEPTAAPGQPIWSVIPLLVLCGAVVRGCWTGVGFLTLRRLRATSVPALLADEVVSAARAIAADVELRLQPSIRQPVTFGWRRPVVLLPPRFADLPLDLQRAVVTHESLHVARRDWLSLLAERCVQSLFWFHPAMWWAVDQAQLAREQIVDAAVVTLMRGRRAYLAALYEFADDDVAVAPLAATFLRKRHLFARARAIAQKGRAARWRVVACTSCLALLTTIATLGAASFAPTAQRDRQETVYLPGDGVTLPVVVHEVRPHYTADALQARIEGKVVLECVVGTEGKPGRIRVVESLDAQYGLDDAAVAALEQWRFRPGTKDGRAVAVQIHVQMAFTLK